MSWLWWFMGYMVSGFIVVLCVSYLDGRRCVDNLCGKNPGWALSVIAIWPLVALAETLTPLGWVFRWANDLGLKHRRGDNHE